MPKYELFYATGGHGGPYGSFGAAVSQARSHLHTESHVDIVNRETGIAHEIKRTGEDDVFTITKSKRRYRAPCP